MSTSSQKPRVVDQPVVNYEIQVVKPGQSTRRVQAGAEKADARAGVGLGGSIPEDKLPPIKASTDLPGASSGLLSTGFEFIQNPAVIGTVVGVGVLVGLVLLAKKYLSKAAPVVALERFSPTNANLVVSDFDPAPMVAARNQAAIQGPVTSSRIEIYIDIPGRELTKEVLLDQTGRSALQQLADLRSSRRSPAEIKQTIADIIMPGVRGKAAPCRRYNPYSRSFSNDYNNYIKEQEAYKKLLEDIGEGTFIIASSGAGADKQTTFHKLLKHPESGEVFFSGADRLPADPRNKKYTDDDLNSSTTHGVTIYQDVVRELKQKFEELKVEDAKTPKNPQKIAEIVKVIQNRNLMLDNLQKTVINPLREIQYIRSGQPHEELENLPSAASIYSELLPEMPAIQEVTEQMSSDEKSFQIITLGKAYNEFAEFVRSPVGKLIPASYKRAMQLKLISEIKKVLDSSTRQTLIDAVAGGNHIASKVDQFFLPCPGLDKTNFQVMVDDFITRELLPDNLFILSKGRINKHFLDPLGLFRGTNIVNKHDLIPTAKFDDIKDHPILDLLTTEEKAHLETVIYGKYLKEEQENHLKLVKKSNTPRLRDIVKVNFQKAGSKIRELATRIGEIFHYRTGIRHKMRVGGTNPYDKMPRPSVTFVEPRRLSFGVADVIDVSGRGHLGGRGSAPVRRRVNI